MSASKDEMCFMVSLYGTVLDGVSIIPLMEEVVELFSVTGHPPSHLTVTAPGFGEKPLQFRRAWKRLQKGASGDLQSVSLYSLINDWRMLSDWNATSAIYRRDDYFHLGASLVAMPDAEERIVEFTRRWMDKIRPSYGIGFFRERNRGPGGYGIGLAYVRTFSGPEHEEDIATARWSDGMDERVYNDGILRDVYPYSLVNRRQLDRDVDGCSLRAWIEAERSRGRLSECHDGYALWTVEREDLPAVRDQLARVGALYAWRV